MEEPAAFEFTDLRRITSSFNRTPTVLHTQNGEQQGVEFGNTGFSIRSFDEDGLGNRFDFMPESKIDPAETPALQIKYAKTLGASLFGLWQWLNEPPQDQVELAGKFGSVKALTNETLIKAITRLFEEHGHVDLVKVNDAENKYQEIEIDLVAFKGLPKQDPLVRRLELLDKLTKDMQISHLVEAGKQ